MNKRLSVLAITILAVLAGGCESDNEHFCARYQYVYDQLLGAGLPSYGEMKQQLLRELSEPGNDPDQARFMLFVLEDWYSELKPAHQASKEFCMQRSRWQAYP